MSGGRKVCIGVDDSQHSERAFLWALANFIRPGDTVSLVTVASPTAEDLAGSGGGQFSADPLFPTADRFSNDVDKTKKLWDRAHKQAEALLENFKTLGEEAQIRMPLETAIISGATVGEAMVEHINKKGYHCAVLGSRGLGTVKRSLLEFVGLGSISDYCVHQLHIPVIIVKPEH